MYCQQGLRLNHHNSKIPKPCCVPASFALFWSTFKMIVMKRCPARFLGFPISVRLGRNTDMLQIPSGIWLSYLSLRDKTTKKSKEEELYVDTDHAFMRVCDCIGYKLLFFVRFCIFSKVLGLKKHFLSFTSSTLASNSLNSFNQNISSAMET